jgi:hypothetical protein
MDTIPPYRRNGGFVGIVAAIVITLIGFTASASSVHAQPLIHGWILDRNVEVGNLNAACALDDEGSITDISVYDRSPTGVIAGSLWQMNPPSRATRFVESDAMTSPVTEPTVSLMAMGPRPVTGDPGWPYPLTAGTVEIRSLDMNHLEITLDSDLSYPGRKTPVVGHLAGSFTCRLEPIMRVTLP